MEQIVGNQIEIIEPTTNILFADASVQHYVKHFEGSVPSKRCQNSRCLQVGPLSKKILRRRGFQYGQEIAIANDAGKYYAVANKLPPTSQPATFGEILGGGKLKEPITGTTFDMRTGARHICALIIS